MISGGEGSVIGVPLPLVEEDWLGGDGAVGSAGDPEEKSPYSEDSEDGEIGDEDAEEEALEASDIMLSSLIFVCSITLLCRIMACSAALRASYRGSGFAMMALADLE